MIEARSLSADYFDAVYAANADPWDFEGSAYEAGKYRATLAALGQRQFANAFEIGCSIGVLTRLLAPRCARLLAVDASEAPLAQARQRCADAPQVRFARMQVPDELPSAHAAFDLVLMSEVGYYWSAADLARACTGIEAALAPGGAWLLVHWTPPVHDYPLRGDEVHDTVLRRCEGVDAAIRHVGGQRHEHYRLDLFVKRGTA